MKSPLRSKYFIWRLISWLCVIGLILQIGHVFFRYQPIVITKSKTTYDDAGEFKWIFDSTFEDPLLLVFPFSYYPVRLLTCTSVSQPCQVPIGLSDDRFFLTIPFFLDMVICFSLASALSFIVRSPKTKEQKTAKL